LLLNRSLFLLNTSLLLLTKGRLRRYVLHLLLLNEREGSYEEEDTCVSYEEEDILHSLLLNERVVPFVPRSLHLLV
jgi:hypothetical protein